MGATRSTPGATSRWPTWLRDNEDEAYEDAVRALRPRDHPRREPRWTPPAWRCQRTLLGGGGHGGRRELELWGVSPGGGPVAEPRLPGGMALVPARPAPGIAGGRGRLRALSRGEGRAGRVGREHQLQGARHRHPPAPELRGLSRSARQRHGVGWTAAAGPAPLPHQRAGGGTQPLHRATIARGEPVANSWSGAGPGPFGTAGYPPGTVYDTGFVRPTACPPTRLCAGCHLNSLNGVMPAATRRPSPAHSSIRSV
jgi:hypothetical protein